jgi:hypothetical protein
MFTYVYVVGPISGEWSGIELQVQHGLATLHDGSLGLV